MRVGDGRWGYLQRYREAGGRVEVCKSQQEAVPAGQLLRRRRRESTPSPKTADGACLPTRVVCPHARPPRLGSRYTRRAAAGVGRGCVRALLVAVPVVVSAPRRRRLKI